jgi:hypothetical protein
LVIYRVSGKIIPRDLNSFLNLALLNIIILNIFVFFVMLREREGKGCYGND